MSHFNLKSLSFYAIAISSVLILFKTVTAYGETKLKAPPHIDGTYQLLKTENLPDCLQGKKLTLNIEQSGIYLFGNLSVKSKSNQSHGLQIPLSGNFKEEKIMMSGKGSLVNCNSQLQLAIQGHKQKNNLVGQIKESTTNSEGVFLARYQKPKLTLSEKH
jgi:hypothetical protein